jgi:UbiD family decarboxylase
MGDLSRYIGTDARKIPRLPAGDAVPILLAMSGGVAMAAASLRALIARLEEDGRVRRITRRVDPTWEAACLAKWVYHGLPEAERFGLVFDDVGSTARLATGILGANTASYAAALDVPEGAINEAWVAALCHPMEPVVVRQAACHQVVTEGAAARLSDLPIPVWTPGKDPAPYITTLVLTRHAETGAQNSGIYRTLVRDDRSVVINLNAAGQGTRNARSYTNQGRPAPIAWVIGADPAVLLAASAKLPYGLDEMRVAGGLAGAPIELVRARTQDLLVPANAEIVIEGEVLPGETDIEGPFGEFAGYMGHAGTRPVARITAITHRQAPIYYAFTSQMPPSESTTIQRLSNAGVILKMLRHDLNEPTVTDVCIDHNYGGAMGHAVIAMDPRDAAHSKRVGVLVATMTALKRVTVVNTDVDIRDGAAIEWALNARYNPVTDTVILDAAQFGHMDPSVRSGGTASKLVMDATQKLDAGPLSLPSAEYMDRALATWRELGLPEFTVPKQTGLRLARS